MIDEKLRKLKTNTSQCLCQLMLYEIETYVRMLELEPLSSVTKALDDIVLKRCEVQLVKSSEISFSSVTVAFGALNRHQLN